MRRIQNAAIRTTPASLRASRPNVQRSSHSLKDNENENPEDRKFALALDCFHINANRNWVTDRTYQLLLCFVYVELSTRVHLLKLCKRHIPRLAEGRNFPRSRLSLECQSKEALPRNVITASSEEAGASNA